MAPKDSDVKEPGGDKETTDRGETPDMCCAMELVPVGAAAGGSLGEAAAAAVVAGGETDEV